MGIQRLNFIANPPINFLGMDEIALARGKAVDFSLPFFPPSPLTFMKSGDF
jgi:hypothetical protein